MKARIKKQSEKPTKSVLNLREAGAYLGCSFRVLKEILDSGELPFRETRGRFFISKKALDDWLVFKPTKINRNNNHAGQ